MSNSFLSSLFSLEVVSSYRRVKSKILQFVLPFVTTILLFYFWIIPVFSQQPVTVSILMRADEAFQWQPLVDKFQQQHPQIKIKVFAAPSDSNQVEDLYTSSFLLGESVYDLVYMDIIWTPKFAAAGWLEDLSGRLSAEELDEFLEGDVEGGTYQGKLYRVPFRSDAGMLYYRTDLLQATGHQPPETFTDLIKISQDIQQRGLTDWGYVWQGKQYEGLSAMFVEILEGSGGFWIDVDTSEVGLDRPEAVEAVEFLRTTIQQRISPPGVTTYAEEETRRLFENGKVAFLRNWPYVYSLASESPIAGQFAIKPMIHEPENSSGACLGGWGLGIAKNSKHPEAAWQVVEFFSSEASQRQYVLETGYVPSRKSLFTDPQIVAKYGYYPKLLEVVQNSALRPPIPQYSQTSDILQRYLSAALTGKMNSESAMKAAAAETRRLLN